MNPNTSEAPDRYCKTTGDGACVSKDPRCMHWPKARRAIDALLFWVWRRFQPKPPAPAEWYDYVGQPQPIDVLLRDAAAALRILGDSPLLRDIEATRRHLRVKP